MNFCKQNKKRNVLLTALIGVLFVFLTSGSIFKNATKEVKAAESTPDYLCFKACEDNSTVCLTTFGNSVPTVYVDYSTDLETWDELDFNEVITLKEENDKVYLKVRDGYKNESFSQKYGNANCRFKMTGKIAASGDITTLLEENGTNSLLEHTRAFSHLFYNCKSLIKAPELPATELSTDCYGDMFVGSGLLEAPKLPATRLASFCYSYMFASCEDLIRAPELPSMNLADYCYSNMFRGCTSLTRAPDLPATFLYEGCYYFMFYKSSVTRVNVSCTDYIAKQSTNCMLKMVEDCPSEGVFIAPSGLTISLYNIGNNWPTKTPLRIYSIDVDEPIGSNNYIDVWNKYTYEGERIPLIIEPSENHKFDTAYYLNSSAQQVTCSFDEETKESYFVMPATNINCIYARFVENKLISIDVDETSYQKEYHYGDKFNYKGITLIRHYEDGTDRTLPVEKAMISGYNPTTLGEQTITVSYAGFTTTFNVTNKDKVITFEIKSLPNKVDYFYGEDFDLTGGYLTVTFLTGTKVVPMDEYMLSGYNKYQLGYQRIEISFGYLKNYQSFNVYVYDKISSISMASLPNKTEYKLNEDLDLEGAEILVKYLSGAEETVEVTSNMVTGYRKDIVAMQTLRVEYQGFKTSFVVNVVDPNSSTPQPEPTPEEKDDNKKENSFSSIIIIIIPVAVGAAVVLSVIGLIIKKKRK